MKSYIHDGEYRTRLHLNRCKERKTAGLVTGGYETANSREGLSLSQLTD
jgi:hypothetical protein